MRTCPQCSQACDSSHRFCPACGYPIAAVATSNDDPLIGITLPGGFVILELIGVGGMGRVYRAEQTALGRTVAVKIIHPSLLGDESASARFITEARTASLLNHPNSVSIIDFGKTDNGQLYLVMEYLRGRDIARVLYEDGPLPFLRVIDILRQVLAALSEAHHLGIIHRDLKPENIVIEPMRTGGDFVKVVDFGLAKLLTASPKSPAITATGIVCGTPDYMAPEQGRGDPIDARSDLYSVGVILFQLLTGRLPFEAESPTQVVLMHLTVPPPDPRSVAPDREIPASLAMVTLSALSKTPADRYQDADSFSSALLAVKNQHTMASGRPSQQPEEAFVQCPQCHQQQPRHQRYCGECGARLMVPAHAVTPVVNSAVPAKAAAAPVLRSVLSKDTRDPPPLASDRRGGQQALLPIPLVSRDEDMAWLLDRLAETDAELRAARIIAAPGMGRSRLLKEFLAHIRTEGDVSVETGPDPWWVEVAYYALGTAIQGLAGLPAQPSARDWKDASPEAQKGLSAMFTQDGPKRTASGEHRHAAAEALRWSFERAVDATPGRRIVLLIDDLHRIDGASRNAFADVIGEPVDLPVLILATHIAGFDARWPGTHPARVLHGLTAEIAASLIHNNAAVESFRAMGERGVPPMYIEQLIRFGQEGGTDPPPLLADLLAMRIARLNASARRVLQAIAVLGHAVKAEHIEQLVDEGTDIERALKELVEAGMVRQRENSVQLQHPLMHEIAEVTMPAGVRRDLHAAAGRIAAKLNYPLEVRAWHALSAQDAFEALLLLDQNGDLALARDDIDGAVLAFRRGLDLARREIFRGELDDPMRAVLIFSRKLAEALTRAGDVTDADGVLREALDVAAPTGEDRAKVLFALAKVARARQRANDAIRYLREAIELAHRSGAYELVQKLEEAGRTWAS